MAPAFPRSRSPTCAPMRSTAGVCSRRKVCCRQARNRRRLPDRWTVPARSPPSDLAQLGCRRGSRNCSTRTRTSAWIRSGPSSGATARSSPRIRSPSYARTSCTADAFSRSKACCRPARNEWRAASRKIRAFAQTSFSGYRFRLASATDHGQACRAGGPAVSRSADRRRVLDTVLGPELVQPARNDQLGVSSEISLVHFTIVADEPDRAHRPVSRQAKPFTIAAVATDESPDVGVFRFHRFPDCLRAYTELLGIDHGKVGPSDDVEPLGVALANRRSERLL